MTSAGSATEPRLRLTQPERVEAMRARLLDATLECLREAGYSELSTNDVVRRAGVSRGALAHHFPAKVDLVAAAAERLIEMRAAEFRIRFAALPENQRTIGAALDVLWSFFEDPTFAVLVELTVAARSSPELREVLSGTPTTVADLTASIFRESFPDLADRPFVDEAVRAILALYSGLAVEGFVDGDPDNRLAAVRELLKLLLGFAQPRRTP